VEAANAIAVDQWWVFLFCSRVTCLRRDIFLAGKQLPIRWQLAIVLTRADTMVRISWLKFELEQATESSNAKQKKKFGGAESQARIAQLKSVIWKLKLCN
jgi:hypothetical protein